MGIAGAVASCARPLLLGLPTGLMPGLPVGPFAGGRGGITRETLGASTILGAGEAVFRERAASAITTTTLATIATLGGAAKIATILGFGALSGQ